MVPFRCKRIACFFCVSALRHLLECTLTSACYKIQKTHVLPWKVCDFPKNHIFFIHLHPLLLFFPIFAVSSVLVWRKWPNGCWILKWISGGLIIWERRFRTSVVVHNESRKFQSHSRQMTTEASRGTFLYTIILYSSCWRGLTALSILCGEAMREPVMPGWAENRHLRLFSILS